MLARLGSHPMIMIGVELLAQKGGIWSQAQWNRREFAVLVIILGTDGKELKLCSEKERCLIIFRSTFRLWELRPFLFDPHRGHNLLHFYPRTSAQSHTKKMVNSNALSRRFKVE